MSHHAGTVYLVGAGPGDPGLVTLRARELLEQAEVVVYDNLANAELLNWTQAGCERVYVGKESGRHAMPQERIEAVLVDRASAGKQVVRLKGGDPFVFGRGGEEATRLEAAGIPFEIVPGVTAALAAAAYTGIPLTHREHSSAISFLTGHENPEKHTLNIDFKAYARTGGTLCIYMGMGQLGRIVAELRSGGLAAETPVAVVEWATLNRQRSVIATLTTVESKVSDAGLGAPAIVFIGETVELHKEVAWFEKRPLFGKRFVVTRAKAQAGELSRRLRAAGADVIEMPFIEIEQHAEPQLLGEVFASLATYEWIVFTSSNGVDAFFDYFHRAFKDLRCLGPMRIAAVGKGTAKAIESHHLEVDVIPQDATSDALVNELLAMDTLDNVKVLVVCGNLSSTTLANKLETKGRAIVDSLPVYRTTHTHLERHPAAQRFRDLGADAIFFTSSSTVKSYLAQRDALQPGPEARVPVYASIGPVTSEAAQKGGLDLAFEAAAPGLDAYVDAAIEYYQSLTRNA